MKTTGQHWYCLHCHRPTELNQDREMNVCGHCGSPHLRLETTQPERMSKERLQELTQGMRQAVEGKG